MATTIKDSETSSREGQTCSQSLFFSDCAIVGEDVQKVRVRGGGGGVDLAPYKYTCLWIPCGPVSSQSERLELNPLQIIPTSHIHIKIDTAIPQLEFQPIRTDHPLTATHCAPTFLFLKLDQLQKLRSVTGIDTEGVEATPLPPS